MMIPAKPICQVMVSTEPADYVCILPEGHAGSCSFVDAMGMCTEDQNCRAGRYDPNGSAHNHPYQRSAPWPR